MSSASSPDATDNNTGAALSSTVCQLCRQRKTKCDRVKPQCKLCVQSKTTCIYTRPRRKPGLRAGYVTELESRIEHLEQSVDELKRSTQAVGFRPGSCEHIASDPSTDSNALAPVAATPRPSLVQDSNPASYGSATNLHTARNRASLRTISSEQPLGRPTASTTPEQDLALLPLSFFTTFVDTWMKENHTWSPILSSHQIQNSLRQLVPPIYYIPCVVLRALCALQISYLTIVIHKLGYLRRRRLSLHLRSQVLKEVERAADVTACQALFIIALLDYGTDEIPAVYNTLTKCCQIAEQSGTYNHLLRYTRRSKPRATDVLPSAYTMNPQLSLARQFAHGDGSLTKPAAGIEEVHNSVSLSLLLSFLTLDSVSHLGVSWDDSSKAFMLDAVSPNLISGVRDSFVNHTEFVIRKLPAIHALFGSNKLYSGTSLNTDTIRHLETIFESLEAYVNNLSGNGYTMLDDGTIDFDANTIFTALLFDAILIMTYQRYTLDTTSQENNFKLARERCENAFVRIANLLQNISDADTELNSPLVSSFLFVAARYRVCLRATSQHSQDPDFDTIMHGINMAGRRWAIARRLDLVLRAAIREVTVGMSSSVNMQTPQEFWDLKLSHLDISEILKKWVLSLEGTLYIGILNGPYA